MGINNNLTCLFSMPDFEKIGKKGTYLSYDQSKGWSIIKLGKMGQFARTVFGMYQNTHLKTVFTQFTHDIKLIALEMSDPQEVLDQLQEVKAVEYEKTTNIKLDNKDKTIIINQLVVLSIKLQQSWDKTYPNNPQLFLNHALSRQQDDRRPSSKKQESLPDPNVVDASNAQDRDSKVKFQEKAEIKVVTSSNDDETVSVDVTFDDRVTQQISDKKSGIHKRAHGTLSVKTQLSDEYDSSPFLPSITFERLPPCPSYDQIVNATRNALCDRIKIIYEKNVMEGLRLFGESYKDTTQWMVSLLLDELQNQTSDVKNVDKLCKDWIKKIQERNVTEEEMDRETFGLLVSGRSMIPQDLLQGKEYWNSQDAYDNGSWQENEMRQIEFRHVSDQELKSYQALVLLIFKDQKIASVMQNFLDSRDK